MAGSATDKGPLTEKRVVASLFNAAPCNMRRRSKLGRSEKILCSCFNVSTEMMRL